MPNLFADLHCHPSLFPFNHMRNSAAEGDPKRFQPWRVMPSDLDAMNEGARGATYTQCDFPKLIESNTRLIFASITPIEKPFFTGGARHHLDSPFGREVRRLVSGQTLVRAVQTWRESGHLEAAKELGGLLRNTGPLRQWLQHFVMRYPASRIRYLMSPAFDYWDEFLREYQFLKQREQEVQKVRFAFMREGQRDKALVQGSHHLVREKTQLRKSIEGHDRTLALVLTIEGGHTFSIGPDQHVVTEDLLFERIAYLRAMTHPIFFITLAHHFDNGICGHAHSIPDIGQVAMDQTPRLNEGFERHNDLGMRVVRELLDLDGKLNDRGGRRILIDVKHMSARARKEYYEEIIKPYNTRHAKRPKDEQARFPKLPVLMSHAAYANVRTLEGLIRDQGRENDFSHRGPFYAWNINLCDEDIHMIHDTEGLIGLCFDQRVAGVMPGQGKRLPAELWPQVLMNQILAMVDVVMLDDRRSPEDRRKIWDVICIGSDYDGFIDPVSCYPTALSLPQFARDLRDHLYQLRHTRMIAEVGVDEIVEKIAWRNAYDFLLKHIDAALG